MKRSALLSLLALAVLFATACGPCGLIEQVRTKIGAGKETVATLSAGPLSELPLETPLSEPDATATATSETGPATPSPQPEQTVPSPDQGESTVDIVNLDDLDSYRVEWSVTSQMADESAFVMGYRSEHVREPPAEHTVLFMDDAPWSEITIIGDEMWVKQGDTWVAAAENHMSEGFDDLAETVAIDEDMTLIGTETVNGVRCKHYLHDFDNGMQKLRREVWIADQAGMPKAPIRAQYHMEVKLDTGMMTTDTVADVFDINQPIQIERPQ
jgi:hypothetical protein